MIFLDLLLVEFIATTCQKAVSKHVLCTWLMGACAYVHWMYCVSAAPTDFSTTEHPELGWKFQTQSTQNPEPFPEITIYFHVKGVILHSCYMAIHIDIKLYK